MFVTATLCRQQLGMFWYKNTNKQKYVGLPDKIVS